MIILYHNHSKITNIVSTENHNFSTELHQTISHVLLSLAKRFTHELFVWCHESQRSNLNVAGITDLFHHQKFLFSYTPNSITYFNRELGYVEDSPFIKLNKEVRYATWQMSSQVGAVYASVLKACMKDLKVDANFDYFLNSLAKRAMPLGLFCYSEPKLLLAPTLLNQSKSTNFYELFQFIKQHYRLRWIFLLFFNLAIYEKRFPLLPLLYSFFYKKRKLDSIGLDKIELLSTRNIITNGSIDVLIPTIGRKDYLFDVLKNIASQTYLPTNVIIIEQNPIENSVSELNYIHEQRWPFNIKHQFTHQAGACNARNIALNLIESEFVFFADDDIVFENDLIENVMQRFKTIGNEILLVAIHLQSQHIVAQPPKQFVAFGTCHAFAKSSCLTGSRFNMALEFGYGEDADFGMQLKDKGFDFLYLSTFTILHLKAPIGGFRTQPQRRWDGDPIQPKPSPTIMFVKLTHSTNEQLLNYKTVLFFKNLNLPFFKNPIRYLKLFNAKWNQSVYWATELKKI